MGNDIQWDLSIGNTFWTQPFFHCIEVFTKEKIFLIGFGSFSRLVTVQQSEVLTNGGFTDIRITNHMESYNLQLRFNFARSNGYGAIAKMVHEGNVLITKS